MATVNFSTNLALALPTTGDLSGTWGAETNSSITNMLDEALGYQAFTATGGSDTLTIPNGTTGVARSIYVQLNGTGGGTVNVPATKTKMYFVFNNTASAITFKVTGQTGVSIPASAKISLVSNGTDVIPAVNYYVGGTNLGSIIPFYFANQAAFPSASTYHGAIAHSHADGAMYFAHSGNWIRMLDADTDVTVAQGGTGLSTLTANNVIIGNGTSTPLFVAPSSSGNVLTSNGTTWTSSAPAAGGITYTTVKTANYTAVNNDGVQTNTTAGAFTVTLPATPSNGNQVFVVDSFNIWGTNNLTIGRNGSTIEGVAQDLVCDITGVSVQCVYNGTTWDIFAQVGGAGGSVVSGPASSTDNAIARFDLTTGKIIQNSVVTIADTTGDVAGVGSLSTTGVISAVISGGTANPGNAFWFSDNSASAMIYARQNGAGDLFALSAGATEQFRVTAAGVAQVASGVKFPATQSASADANTLDDYEEGSFTFTGTGFTTSPTKTAYYTKIGNQVTVQIPDITGTSNTTAFTLTGLPAALRSAQAYTFVGLVYNASVVYTGYIYGAHDNAVTVYWNAVSDAFTASGVKGIPNNFSITYTLA